MDPTTKEGPGTSAGPAVQKKKGPNSSAGGKCPSAPSGSREPTMCQMYGHCYCGNLTLNSVAHQVCCVCGHRMVDTPQYLLPSIQREWDTSRQYPEFMYRLVD